MRMPCMLLLHKTCSLTHLVVTWNDMQELDEAEQALCEANILDPHNAQVPAIILLICARMSSDK